MAFDNTDPFHNPATLNPAGASRIPPMSTSSEQTEGDQKKAALVVPDYVTPVSSVARVPMAPMIHVDLRVVNMGMDIKLEDDPFQLQLNGVMKADELVSEIQIINRELETCRATSVDQALLLMGPMMLPLIPYAIRKKAATKKRRKIMEMCVRNFNNRHPDLLMRWMTRPEKHLLIMRRSDAEKEMNR
jgi:hypothetical protein